MTSPAVQPFYRRIWSHLWYKVACLIWLLRNHSHKLSTIPRKLARIKVNQQENLKKNQQTSVVAKEKAANSSRESKSKNVGIFPRQREAFSKRWRICRPSSMYCSLHFQAFFFLQINICSKDQQLRSWYSLFWQENGLVWLDLDYK